MTREHEEMMSIPDEAAQWWVVLRDGSASAAERREFAGWVAQDPGRVEAMLRVARIHKSVSQPDVHWPATSREELIRQAKAGAGEAVVPLRGRKVQRPEAGRRPAMRTALGLAASLLLVVSLSWFALAGGQDFQTEVGEQRSVMLKDGSRVTLNTASRMDVRLREDRRVIRLVKGEALFEVAPDAERPLDVQVGDVVVRAVGTQFDIDLRATRTVITVIEGRVAVIPAGTSGDQAPMLLAGERLVIDAQGLQQVEKGVDLHEATAWTQRQLVFRRRPLGEIADELSRYNVARVEIRSPALKAREVTGTFRTDDLTTFVALLSGIPGVRVTADGSGGYIVTSDESPASRE
jgi:transmembrane sensor